MRLEPGIFVAVIFILFDGGEIGDCGRWNVLVTFVRALNKMTLGRCWG